MGQEQLRPGIKRDRRSKLTEEDVAQIKAHLQQGKTPASLARRFKVHHASICKIRDMKRWRRVVQRQYRYRNYPKDFVRSRFARVNKLASVD